MDLKIGVVFSALLAGCLALAPPPPGARNIDDVIPRVYNTSDDDAPVSFKHIYVAKNGAVYNTKPHFEVVTITATSHVSNEAMQKAAVTVGLMTKYMPEAVYSRVAKGLGVGLFTKAEGLTVYPEMTSHADSPSCHGHCSGSCAHTCVSDGRKYTTIGGLTSRRSYVVDDNVLCNSHDAYHKTLNVLGHEYAHQIMFHLDSTWRSRIFKAYTDIHARGVWHLNSYAMRNADEYFAEATGAFFLSSHMISANGGMNMCGSSSNHLCSSVSQVRAYLRQHDPEIYSVLEYVYTNNHPDIHVPLKTCM